MRTPAASGLTVTPEDILIIDEYSGEQELAFLNRILDKYPLTVELKGASVDAKWTKVIITSISTRRTGILRWQRMAGTRRSASRPYSAA